jgi:hypothetical protein
MTPWAARGEASAMMALHGTPCERDRAMAHKTKASRPSKGDQAAEQADFKAWLADAVAALQREHNVNPGTIPIRVWRQLYIQGRTPMLPRIGQR